MIAEIHHWRNLERWLPGSGSSLDVTFPTVPLGEVLRSTRRRVLPEQFHEYQPITIHFDGSIVARERTESFKGGMFAAHAGELVFSKIDVRNGAIGLVPPEFGPVVVTSEYPIYAPDQQQVNARYLSLLLRTPNFQHLLKRAASGTSGRKRVNRESFEELEIPLPEPDEQKRLVNDYESAISRAEHLEAEARDTDSVGQREFEAELGLVPPQDLPRRPFQIAWFTEVDRWSHEGILDRKILAASGKPTEKYPLVSLGDVVLDLENGWSPQCLTRPAKETEWGVLKLGAVSYGVFDETANKALPAKLKPQPDLEVQPGNVLISRANILRLVGACALVRETRPRLMLSDKIFRVVFRRETSVLPEFLTEILKTPSVRQQIEANATGTSPTMKNISKPALLDLMFPLPDGEDGLKVQERLISNLQSSRQKASLKRAEAVQLRSTAWAEFQAAIFR